MASPAARSAPRSASAGHALRHQRLDPRRHEGRACRPQIARERLQRSRWTRCSPSRSIRPTTWTPSKPSCSASARRRYVLGSHEFYLGYAVQNQKLLCLDAGHFHPTETIADKISSVMLFLDEILLHVSRGIRWDSDHVVILNDDLRAIAEEIVRGGFLPRVHIGLDYFDASINRVAAWVIGTRAMIKALLGALLEPTDRCGSGASGDYTAAWPCSKNSRPCPWAPSGITTA